MVLNELGKKINAALRAVNSAPYFNQNLINQVLKDVCSALIEADVNIKLVSKFRLQIKKRLGDMEQEIKSNQAEFNQRKYIQKIIIDELCSLVDPKKDTFVPKKHVSNVILMVGLQGSGKTTTCSKLAYFYKSKGWKTCLVCADTFRAGAFDQLKQNANKAKIPFYGSYTISDPVQISKEGVEKFKNESFEIIIVDTSGRHKQEDSLFEEMKQIERAINPNNIIFVMDATIGQAAEMQAQAFKSTVNVGSVIITKMDGHAKGGGAIRMGDINGLLESMQDIKIEDSSDFLDRLGKGMFTLRDMHTQLQTISKLGPMNKLMSMIPGMSPELINMFEQGGGNTKMKRIMAIMNSMTKKELDGDSRVFKIQPNRKTRISRGSGTSLRDVDEMLMQYEQFSKMIKKMGGSGGLFQNMMNNPNFNTNRSYNNQPSQTQSPFSFDQLTQSMPEGMRNMMQQISGQNGGMLPNLNLNSFQNMFGQTTNSNTQNITNHNTSSTSEYNNNQENLNNKKKKEKKKVKIIRGRR